MRDFKNIRRIKTKTRKNERRKYKDALCEDDMTFEECELAILKHAVDETEKIQGKLKTSNEDIQHIISIVEEFLRKKKRMCYGGTAVNNILPKQAQFYNRELEIPDYDFFSPDALDDAKELADIYYEQGYIDVEAKSGVHMGTYKVFVNFIPIADITMMDRRLYDAVYADSITLLGIHYAPPDYLRMAMYLELSRPAGDVSRWEKVLTRLNLLNKYYPMELEVKCKEHHFSKKILASESKLQNRNEEDDPYENRENSKNKLFFTIRDSFAEQNAVFFGGYALHLYSKYSHNKELFSNKVPSFDVIHVDPEACAEQLKKDLLAAGFHKIRIFKYPAIGELIPERIEVYVDKRILAFIYKPIACHSYNKVFLDNKELWIGTIDTILAFYLSFIYIDDPNFDKDRLLCMAHYLFTIEERNRLENKGLLRRFSIECYGKQMTLEDNRAEKAEKYKELKGKQNTKEFEMWFLRYIPDKLKNKTPVTNLMRENSEGSETADELFDEPIKKGKIKAVKKRKTPKEKVKVNEPEEIGQKEEEDVAVDVEKDDEGTLIDYLFGKSKESTPSKINQKPKRERYTRKKKSIANDSDFLF